MPRASPTPPSRILGALFSTFSLVLLFALDARLAAFALVGVLVLTAALLWLAWRQQRYERQVYHCTAHLHPALPDPARDRQAARRRPRGAGVRALERALRAAEGGRRGGTTLAGGRASSTPPRSPSSCCCSSSARLSERGHVSVGTFLACVAALASSRSRSASSPRSW